MMVMKKKRNIYSKKSPIAVIDKELEDTELEIAKLAELWKAELKEEKLSWYKKIFGE